jgi:hypothetical protein
MGVGCIVRLAMDGTRGKASSQVEGRGKCEYVIVPFYHKHQFNPPSLSQYPFPNPLSISTTHARRKCLAAFFNTHSLLNEPRTAPWPILAPQGPWPPSSSSQSSSSSPLISQPHHPMPKHASPARPATPLPPLANAPTTCA